MAYGEPFTASGAAHLPALLFWSTRIFMNSTRFVAAAVVFLSLSLAASAQVTPAGGDNDAQIAQLKAQIAALEAAKTQTASGPSAAAQAPDNSPLRPIEQSDLVVKDSSGAPMVADKTG
jgi:hypothetical protein